MKIIVRRFVCASISEGVLVEAIMWIAIFLGHVLPLVLIVLAFLFVTCLLPYCILRVNFYSGLIAFFVSIVFVSFLSIKYIYIIPEFFVSECIPQAGMHVMADIDTKSYILDDGRVPTACYYGNTDAHPEDAIIYVARKNVDYVEIQDVVAADRDYGIYRELREFAHRKDTGYFKVYRTTVDSGQCRWLMPSDVKPMPYKQYLTISVGNKINSSLHDENSGNECIGVEFVEKPSSKYRISFNFNKIVHENISRDEIILVDEDRKKTIGRNVMFRHIPDGVDGRMTCSGFFKSIAFDIWTKFSTGGRIRIDSLRFDNKVVGKFVGIVQEKKKIL